MTALLSTNTISPRLLSDEFTLTIALVVFVMITLILLTLLIALAASKNFRKVFFREKTKKSDKKQRAAESNEAAANAHGANDPNQPEYFEGVMTVPIASPKKRWNKKAKEDDIDDIIPTIALPEEKPATEKSGAAEKPNTVYTVRSSTASARTKTSAQQRPTQTSTAARRPAPTRTVATTRDRKTSNYGPTRKQ